MHLSVIIPTYNERDNIVLLLWLLREYLKDQPGPDGRQLEWEVVVVDDGSPDARSSVWAAHMALATGDWVVLLDGDFSHHPRYIPRMLAKQAATGCDIVSGTRYAPGGGVAGWTLMRKEHFDCIEGLCCSGCWSNALAGCMGRASWALESFLGLSGAWVCCGEPCKSLNVASRWHGRSGGWLQLKHGGTAAVEEPHKPLVSVWQITLGACKPALCVRQLPLGVGPPLCSSPSVGGTQQHF
ncbi:dolichol-phosphate mannosyltransferase subunit 1 [Haematococcus lacustris]|uniref:dolichyl-phosphate beta-D-mannosyltransferase n=1 Tax=Haematococcus lacustris TaxID=44745 RepID=A0A699ZVV7_HAELA|nr:dolichol-phosphate mannosyltransferase subunit 1 [Haematococcus lacustris]